MTCFCTNVRGSQYYLSIQSCEPLLLAHCTFSLLAASRRRSRSFTAGQRRTLSFRQKHVQGFSLPWRVCWLLRENLSAPKQNFDFPLKYLPKFQALCLPRRMCATANLFKRTFVHLNEPWTLPPTHSRSQISTRLCYESDTWISSDSLLSSPCE